MNDNVDDISSLQALLVPGIKVAMSDNLGFGGHNGVVVFKKFEM